MPPKNKFTKEEIIEDTLNIVREKGFGFVTAKEIAARLNTSTRPIFTYFKTMDGLHKEVYKAAVELYHEYVSDGLRSEIPFLGFGMQYIRFAREETELYKFIFIDPPDGEKFSAMAEMKRLLSIVSEPLQRIYNINSEQAEVYFRDMWLVVYALSALIATGENIYSDEEIQKILTGFSISICRSIKEIPGFTDGSFDRDKAFMEAVRGNTAQLAADALKTLRKGE